MIVRASLALLVVLFLCGISLAAEPLEALRKKEEAARERAADEVLKLVRFCVKGKAYSVARVEAAKGIAVSPGHKNLAREVERLQEKEDAPARGFGVKLAKEREKSYGKVGGHLAKIALLYEKGGFPAEFDRLANLTLAEFPTKSGLSKFKLKWFAPYRTWVRSADAGRLAKGWEEHEGAWLEPKAVAELDAKHATFDNPWVLTDGVHELRTNLTLREAKQVLGHTKAFREFFLREFADEWHLEPAKGKLPVVVARTQEEFKAELGKATRSGTSLPPQGAAFYLWTSRPLNPCFATLEPVVQGGQVVKTDVNEMLPSLQHELTHQLAYEMSKFASDNSRMQLHQFWCVEAIANFMFFFELGEDGWTLTHPRTIPMGVGATPGAFAYCKENLLSLPRLKDFFGTPYEKFPTVANYMQAATVAYFLLEGEKGKHRASFIKLLETVHRMKDGPTTFEECFPGVGLAVLQREWESFVRSIRLDR